MNYRFPKAIIFFPSQDINKENKPKHNINNSRQKNSGYSISHYC